MKKLILAIFLAMYSTLLLGQTDSTITVAADTCNCGTKNLILDFAEEMPSPSMGWEAFNTYIMRNINLQDSTLRKGPGTVYIALTVDLNGDLCNTFVRKGFAEAPEFNDEALRLVLESGKWNAGKMNGKAVCVRMNIPIKVCLQ